MTILSVDLAYKHYKDFGAVLLTTTDCRLVKADFIDLKPVGNPKPYPPPQDVATYLNFICVTRHVRVMVLDGPQGWKSDENTPKKSRTCENKEYGFDTHGKTGLPGQVESENYDDFFKFCIALYDALTGFGWERLGSYETPLEPNQRVLVESYPYSAWKGLGLRHLPAKANCGGKANEADIIKDRLKQLTDKFSLHLSTKTPTHDQLQALVAGLAGLALERNQFEQCDIRGDAPFKQDDYWREGYIVSPKHPFSLWP